MGVKGFFTATLLIILLFFYICSITPTEPEPYLTPILLPANLNNNQQTIIKEQTTMTTYFNCPFLTEGGTGYELNDSWPGTEPCGYTPTTGTWHWVNNENNTDYAGSQKIVADPADAEKLCFKMELVAEHPVGGNQHTKLYNIPSRETANWAGAYVTEREAYYHFEAYFPSAFSVEEWLLLWQVPGEEGVYGNPEYTYSPQFGLIFGNDNLYLQADGYYWSNSVDREWTIMSLASLPRDQWVSFDIYVKQGTEFQAEDGTVIVKVNGATKMSSTSFASSTYSGTPYMIWGIGVYGGADEAQGTKTYFRNVQVLSDWYSIESVAVPVLVTSLLMQRR